MELRYLRGDDGRAYFTKGHVPLDEFMAAVEKETGPHDSILKEKPEHVWLRATRDFGENQTVYGEAVPNSQGAFRATWLQDSC